MKQILLIALVAGTIGSGLGWFVHYNRWGYRESKFGPFDFKGEVTLANIEEHANFSETIAAGAASVEMLDDTVHDFGVMRPNTNGEHLFRIRNDGDVELTLRIGASTCKCTIGELEDASLAPGEETEIKLSWTVKPGSDKFEQSAQLLTNSPGQRAITLKIVGKVVTDVELLPTVWTFGEASVEDDFELSGEVYNYTPFAMTPDVEAFGFTSERMTELADFTVEEIPLEEVKQVRKLATQGFRVTAKVKKGVPQGSVSQNLLFRYQVDLPESVDDATAAEAGTETASLAEHLEAARKQSDDDLARTVAVPVRGRVVGPLSMIPSAKLKALKSGKYRFLFEKLGRAEQTQGSAFVIVRGKNRENLKLRVTETSPDSVLSAELGPPKNRGSMILRKLTLSINRGDETIERMGKTKDDYGKVLIVADDASETKMEIQVKFAVEGR